MSQPLVHRHYHDWGDAPVEQPNAAMPESQLDWIWHAHPYEPDHVDTTYVQYDDGSGHPDISIPLTPSLQAEVHRQAEAFLLERSA